MGGMFDVKAQCLFHVFRFEMMVLRHTQGKESFPVRSPDSIGTRKCC